MPAASSKVPAKRGRPAFKPPRPSANTSTKRKITPRRKSAPAAAVTSSSTSDDELAALAAENPSDSEINSSNTVTPLARSQDPPPVIPPNLLTRLLHHYLEKKEGGVAKIGKEANVLVGKYMETFVREAIARAAFERAQAAESTGTRDGFLEVEDLEKLAPQLLLDF